MKYDGLGNRLEMTTYVDGTASTTRYQLDNGQTLAAIAGGTSTFTLYGRGVIGTFSTEWSYILQDGAGSMRQLAKPDGAVALSVSYTPWGDTLEVYGTGMLDIGYLGGVYDAGTGLIYMGNGQYYDPSTGRFLTRGANADQSNPYTPWNSDPSGMLIAPLALLALVFGRKKNRTKLDHFVILIVIGLSVGLSVSACGGNSLPVPSSLTVTIMPNFINIKSTPLPYTDQGKFRKSGGEVVKTPTPPCDETPTPAPTLYDGPIPVPVDIPNLLGQWFGTEPDYRGLAYACIYRDLIINFGNEYPNVDPIMVAVGIAIQGNYYGRGLDIGQQKRYEKGEDTTNDGFGIGQFTQKQIEDLLGSGHYPWNPEDAIQAMYAKIDWVLNYDEVKKCTPTDKMIFAIIAQQNYQFNPIDNVLGDNPLYEKIDDDHYEVRWNDYFELSYKKDKSKFSPREIFFNDILAGGKDYQSQYMLQRAVHDIEVLTQGGWYDLPEGVLLELLRKYAY